MEVLNAILGYVKHFFSCSGCSKHYQQMASNMTDEVRTDEDSVLWLWQAHNQVNVRLKGDTTEDPFYKKVIFPPKGLCPLCHLHRNRNTFFEIKVLRFLQSYYSIWKIVE